MTISLPSMLAHYVYRLNRLQANILTKTTWAMRLGCGMGTWNMCTSWFELNGV